MLRIRKTFVLLLCIACFSGIYQAALVFHNGFPPGADIGLHGSLVYSITQGGNVDFMWNNYHMGGGNSNTFPGYHIFVAFVSVFTGLPVYLAEALVAVLFSSLIVMAAFVLTRKVLNESIALIAAFLVGVSYYDIYMLLWSGYPNTVTLTLIPLAFFLLLEKNRFSRLPWLTVVSLLSATIFLTHSLSTFIYVIVVFATVLTALIFPRKLGVERKTVLEWLIPLFIGALVVSPFLVQAAPFYLNLNSAVYTSGLPAIEKLLLPMRLIPINIVLPFFACFFLGIVFFRFTQRKIIQLPTILLICWLIIPTFLTQSYLFGLYTDYERFLYFANLPLIMIVGTGIYLGARLLSKSTSWLFAAKKSVAQRLPMQTTVAMFAAILILVAFFGVPNLFMIPSDGFTMQNRQQVMNKPGYEAIQWVKNYTPPNSVLVADGLYGWWLGGFSQRPTISAIEPYFITNTREFQPALLANRLLDTDYLVDNGLIQIREDGGYLGNHNPAFLAKLGDSYYPYPFINFNNSQTAVTFSRNGELSTVLLSELPVKGMRLENSSASASITVSWGNEFFNFTQKATVYQGVRFVNMSETVSSGDPTVSFVDLNFEAQTRGNVTLGNNSSICLVDPYTNVAGQLIFTETQPAVTKTAQESFEMHFNLAAQAKTEIYFYVAVFEYPDRGSDAATKAGLQELFNNNTNGYLERTADYPLDVFDYRQAIADLNASYIAIRDHAQIVRFAKDPLFKMVFVNDKVAIFQVQKF